MSSKVQFKARAATNRLFIHCAATKPSMDIGVREIRQWHKGQGWFDVGYHFIIKRDGTVEDGRGVEQIGSHAKGHNNDSIGVCLVGGLNEAGKPAPEFTQEQWDSLHKLTMGLIAQFPTITEVLGHNNVAAKACPSFDVKKWFTEGTIVAVS